ncbi:DIP1984 family protein [Vagococcus sp. BWB3-3]|uniref:DIP1984 family protein n=1 Tax=Vagococcus allomyrinae TaxID=2794353 RepID=A0A940P271_9ENTE|nr:DIP1984 family protein [Vagococcus allomyrinae]MBP1039680.1 DIP1984 family protein [Vagococcus allomyrinae]
MKLAEALLLRGEYQTKVDNLQSRILQNLKIQEGDIPNEEPKVLLTEAFELNEQLNELIKRVNERNNQVLLPDGRSLAQALVDRETLVKKRRLLVTITEAGSEQEYRYSRSEIKFQLTLSLGEIHKQIDQLSRQFRELDTIIQGLNWSVDL